MVSEKPIGFSSIITAMGYESFMLFSLLFFLVFINCQSWSFSLPDGVGVREKRNQKGGGEREREMVTLVKEASFEFAMVYEF